jgi:hypothetical protein
VAAGVLAIGVGERDEGVPARAPRDRGSGGVGHLFEGQECHPHRGFEETLGLDEKIDRMLGNLRAFATRVTA